MPAPKICADPACYELVRGVRFCDAHRRERAWSGSGGSKRTNTHQHRARRKRVLERDGHLCRIRYGDICLGEADQMDHVVPLGEGGADEDFNCIAACGPCHRRKSSLEGHRAAGHNV
jgi:5-methylcytosine-specific restriction protein A